MTDTTLDKNKRDLVIHPFLFSCLPVLLLLAFNTHEIFLLGAINPLVISVLLSFIVWVVLRHFLKSVKAGLILSWIILMILIHGNVSKLLESEYSQFNLNFVLLPIFLIMGVLGTVFFVKIKANSELNSIFNVVAITIFVILVSIFLIYNSSQIFQYVDDSNVLEIPVLVNDIQKKPDVFVFLLDEFASEKQLEMDFNYSLKPFITQLEERDFIVPDLTFTNYPNTIFSIPSSLNMKYADDVIEKYQSDSKDIRVSYPLLKHNNVMKIFKAYGYKITVFANGFEGRFSMPVDSPYIDEKLCDSNLVDIGIMLTLVDIYLPMPTGVNLTHQFTGYNYYYHFDQCVFSFIEDYKDDKEQPHFVYAHLMLPHWPYRYDSEGNNVNPTSTPNDANAKYFKESEYLDQVIFTEKKSLEMIDSIQKQNPESIIIIFSDHGMREEITSWENPTDKDLIRGFNNISALYFPDKEIEIPKKLSLVNIFRIFFNEYFDTHYEILEDRHIWYNDEEPFINKDVTNRLNSLIRD